MEVKTLIGYSARESVDSFYEVNQKPHKARDSDIFFIAYDMDKIIGTVRFCVEENVPLLRSMLISESYRRRGVGQLLLREFESYLIKMNISKSFCIAYSHLEHFYGLIGFKKIIPSDAPNFLHERFSSYLRDYPENEYIMMERR